MRRALQRVSSLWGALLLASCAGALHQVPVSAPHGVLELRFAHTGRDNYSYSVRIDDGEEREVKSGQRVRLRPGTHVLELASIAHSYGLRTIPVTRPGPCVDLQCTRFGSVTEPQTALVETGRERCVARLDIPVVANSASVAQFQVAADQSCSARAAPATRP